MTDVVSRLATSLADRYAIERELGAGGMATVYLAGYCRRHARNLRPLAANPSIALLLLMPCMDQVYR